MFAALYGDVAPHAWWGPELDQDAYSLFHSRARATQWLDETEDGAPGLWGMNDAGWQHPLARADLPLAAWFQVEVQAVAANRPLPVQPFLQCAGETVARAGTLRLDAVQVLLPIQGMGGVADSKDALAPSLLTRRWFDAANPESRTAVRVTLDSGQAASIPAAAPHLLESLSRLDQHVFVGTSLSPQNAAPIAPPFDDTFWNGPPMHRATFDGVLAEWSVDAVGWLCGFLADLSARRGVNKPLLATVLPATRTATHD